MNQFYQAPEFTSDQWKSFGMETEAGRMLNKLYAGSKPKVNYPRLRTRKSEGSKARFIPGGGKIGVNPRENKIMKVEVERPKVGLGKKYKSPAAIDCIRRRKTKASIEEMNKTREFDVKGFQGPATKAVSTEQNKRMLQMSNQFNGGNILPDAGSYQALQERIPLHLATGSEKAQAFHNRKQKEKTIEKDVSSASRRLRLLREDFENEMHQIEEDEKFLNELQRDGSAKAKEQIRHVMAQTAAHVRRARSLDEEIKMLTEAENDI
eukprot:Stramenopile-MAST_4_protein_437